MFTLQRNIPLAPLTTFRVGGQAAYFTRVTGALELACAIEYAEEHHLPIFIFSGGSNVLFSDKGFAGLVIQMQDGGITVVGERIFCGAGVALFDVVAAATGAGLAGIERLAGIPGSLGGAVRGNAGAFGSEIGTVVSAVKVYVKDVGMVKEYTHSTCDFGYRMSVFKKNPNLVILSVEIKLVPGDKDLLQKVADETIATRESKHPQKALCAGSFFMNPSVRDKELHEEFKKDTGMDSKDGKLPAGWLIDHVGLRGKRIGGALVSVKHPNYIVNTGEATAEDIITLASLVKTRVRDELRVQLKEEIQYVGL